MYQSNVGVKGRYKIERVHCANTSFEWKEEVVPWFDNIITDQGLNWICNDSLLRTNYLGRCMVGSSSTAPDVSDVNLGSQLGYNSSIYSFSQGNYGGPDYIHYGRWVFRLYAGEGTGNIAEVGMGNSSNYVGSRALILDGGGSPTTITKLSDEILDITYEMQFSYGVSGTAGGFTLTGDKGSSYTYTAYPIYAASNFAVSSSTFHGLDYTNSLNAYDGSFVSVVAVPSGSSASMGSMTPQTYTSGTFYRDYVSTNTITLGNLGSGILSMSNVGERRIGFHQWTLNTAIPKTSSDALTLNFRISIARA